jgi:hypothetical protein
MAGKAINADSARLYAIFMPVAPVFPGSPHARRGATESGGAASASAVATALTGPPGAPI